MNGCDIFVREGKRERVLLDCRRGSRRDFATRCVCVCVRERECECVSLCARERERL